MSSEQIAEFKQFGDRVTRDTSLIQAMTTDSRDARDITSRLASATARSARAEASVAQQTIFAERLSVARERGESMSIDIAQDPHNLQMFTRYALQYGGDSTAAHALMASELARQALGPTRLLTDGSALPTSFAEVRATHVRTLDDPTMSPDIATRRRENDRRVSASLPRTDTPQPPPGPSPIREEVRTGGERVRSGAEAGRAALDSRMEIVESGDGTLTTKRSLLKQSAKQVAEDASASTDNAKEAVKDLLRKK